MKMVSAIVALLVAFAVALQSSGVAAWEPTYATDTGNDADFYTTVKKDIPGLYTEPDPCYNSVYQYTRDLQYGNFSECVYDTGDFNKCGTGFDTGEWNNYNYLETHQHVFTSTPDLSSNDYILYVEMNPKWYDVKAFRVSYLGTIDNNENIWTTDTMVSVENARNTPTATGIKIPWSQIVNGGTYEPDFGSYERNPLHVTITPMKCYDPNDPEADCWPTETYQGQLRYQYPVLEVFIDGTEVLADPKCEGAGWCTGAANEICCYLRADANTGYTLGYDWTPAVSNLGYHASSTPVVCYDNDDSLIQAPQNDGSVWTSSLNNLFKSTRFGGSNYGTKKIKIVLDALTSIEFPLSNLWIDAITPTDDYPGYDVPADDVQVEITGYGRINGRYASRLYGWKNSFFNGDDGKTIQDPEYKMFSRLLWISGSGKGNGNTGWQEVQDFNGFNWFDGTPATAAAGTAADPYSNDGNADKYSIIVQHVQMGYGPPVTDAPITLGDFVGLETPGVSDANKYGGSVLTRDVKFISFSGQSDGISMKNPASFGTGLFIHGSDDLLKSYTSFEESWWAASAITYFAGQDNYGSLSCPCCFGPGNGWTSPAEANRCEYLNIKNVMVPVLQSNIEPTGGCDGYDVQGRGLITTRWLDIEPTKGYSFNNSGNPINVKSLKFSNWIVMENGWNKFSVPYVNWLMNSYVESDCSTSPGPTYWNLDTSDGASVTFDKVYSRINSDFGTEQGMLVYNLGAPGTSYVAYVDDTTCLSVPNVGGCINALGLNAHMYPSPCVNYDGVAANPPYPSWGVCPSGGDSDVSSGANVGIDALYPGNCWGYDASGVPNTFDQLCLGYDGTAQGRNAYNSASIYGKASDGQCYSGNANCGLAYYYDQFFPQDPDPIPDDDDEPSFSSGFASSRSVSRGGENPFAETETVTECVGEGCEAAAEALADASSEFGEALARSGSLSLGERGAFVDVDTFQTGEGLARAFARANGRTAED